MLVSSRDSLFLQSLWVGDVDGEGDCLGGEAGVAALMVIRGCLCLLWFDIGLAVVAWGCEEKVTFLHLGLPDRVADEAEEADAEEAGVVEAASRTEDTGGVICAGDDGGASGGVELRVEVITFRCHIADLFTVLPWMLGSFT